MAKLISDPAASDYIRYLTSKKALDDRSLNRQVWDHLVKAVRNRSNAAPLQVLELGCGIGTMLERLLDWGLLTQASYTGIDVEPEFIREARQRFGAYAGGKNANLTVQPGAPLIFRTTDQDIKVTFTAIDLFDFLEQQQGKSTWDLLVAHAVLDLIDLPATLPRLLSLLGPGGLFYLTLNFDGATILEPPIDLNLDRRIETLYHRTMDTRRRKGQPAGSSVTGRQLIRRLRDTGARLVAAGSSDWVVFPGQNGYPGEEASFLHSIIETIGRALYGHPDLDSGRLEQWLAQRHDQIDAAELIYIAHQLDVMGYID
jgi:SAM-dependent methyltransferase